MTVSRTLLVLFLLTSASTGHCRARPKDRTAAETEARNETQAPGFSGEVREAHRITSFLVDALLLNNAQLRAVEAYTLAERQALALALTPTDAALAQREYLLAVRRVLATSQLHSYVALRQQLDGTMLPLDTAELALR